MSSSTPAPPELAEAQAQSSTAPDCAAAEPETAPEPACATPARDDDVSSPPVDKDLERLDQALERMDSLLESGQLKQAIDAEQQVHRLFDALDADLSGRHKNRVQRRLTRAQPRLQEMRAWRHWGTTLARESLIEQIEQLTDSGQSPAAIARTVQQARTTWQNWDRSGDSGGKALWDRFDTACTKAYEACRAHFQRQAEQRQANRAEREALCERLEACFTTTDWRDPDWRALDKFTQRGRREWYRMGPVDRKFKKPLDKRFQAAWSQLEDPLARERKRNLKLRRALIEEVRALGRLDETGAAVEQVKQAQSRWQPTVLGTRPAERALWDEFKSACDAVFGQRDNQRREDAVLRKSNVRSRIALCEQIEALADEAQSDGPEAVRDRVARAGSSWQQLGEVPRKHEAGLEKRFRRACTRAEQRARQAERRRAQQLLAQLRERAGICADLEATALAGSPDPAATLDDARRRWAQLPDAEAGALAMIGERFELASRALDNDVGALDSLRALLTSNLTRSEDLCLQLEVFADVESPPQHAKARMALQVKRLSAALSGAKGEDLLVDPAALRRAYWLTGAIDPPRRRELDTRFRSVEAALELNGAPTGPSAESDSS